MSLEMKFKPSRAASALLFWLSFIIFALVSSAARAAKEYKCVERVFTPNLTRYFHQLKDFQEVKDGFFYTKNGALFFAPDDALSEVEHALLANPAPTFGRHTISTSTWPGRANKALTPRKFRNVRCARHTLFCDSPRMRIENFEAFMC